MARLEYPRATCTADLCTVAGRGGHWMFSAVSFLGTHTVVAIHDGRPVILQFEWFSSSLQEVQAIIDSFRFLDSAPSPEASPTPSGSGWRVVTDVRHGYALGVPAGWEDRECCSPGGRTFYAGEADPRDDHGWRRRWHDHDLPARGLCGGHGVPAVRPAARRRGRGTDRCGLVDPHTETRPADLGRRACRARVARLQLLGWTRSDLRLGVHHPRWTADRAQVRPLRGKSNPSEQQRIVESFVFLD